MKARDTNVAFYAGGAWLLLASPPLRTWLESSMALHMLVQLPLLAVIGYCIGHGWNYARPEGRAAHALRFAQTFNAGGITGMIVAGFVMVLWMLPRFLDSARLDGPVDAIKFLSVPAAGVAVALSWPRLHVIARAVVHLEALATLLRFGWGYLAAHERLCLAYLADDQQRAGTLLLWAGAIYALVLAWRPMFGQWPVPLHGGHRKETITPGVEAHAKLSDSR